MQMSNRVRASGEYKHVYSRSGRSVAFLLFLFCFIGFGERLPWLLGMRLWGAPGDSKPILGCEEASEGVERPKVNSGTWCVCMC